MDETDLKVAGRYFRYIDLPVIKHPTALFYFKIEIEIYRLARVERHEFFVAPSGFYFRVPLLDKLIGLFICPHMGVIVPKKN